MTQATPNGKQLYGFSRLWATLKMGLHPELKNFNVKQKLALNYASKEVKMTRLDGKLYSNTFTPYYPSKAYDRYLQGVREVVAGRPRPLISNFAVTSLCPCDCWHCSLADRLKTDHLSLEELQNAIKEVQKLGVSVIGITGGEPLLRKDLEDIIASIGEDSMPLLFTTGFRLDRARVRELKKAGLKIPVISLDHYRPEIHDKGRGKEGMYDTALNAIDLFKSEGLYTAVSFVPDKELTENKDELYKTIELFRSLGVNDMRLTSPIQSGYLTCKPEERLSQENRETLFELQKMCVKKKGYPGVFGYDFFEGKDYYGCGAGYYYMFIDSQGNLCPCDFTMITLGNIREKPLAEIWKLTNRKFCSPGCNCYANEISDLVAAKNSKVRPLSVEDSIDVISQVPTFEPGKSPVFFEKMGLKQPEKP